MIIAAVLIQFYPIIFDLIMPLDEPRPCKLIIGVEYFVPQDKYFITKALHELITASICGLIMLTTATQMLIFIVHSIGMFKIASYRVRYSLEDSVLYMSNMEKERAICESIMQIVIAHRKAMKSSDVVISIFNVPVSIIAILAVLSLSTNLFRFLEAINLKDTVDLGISFVIITIHLVVLFAASLIGQKVMDYNNEIFRLIYNTSWYLMPVPSQKLILFLMQKAGKEFNLKLGFLFVGKIENFTTLLNNALSYVTVMYSAHNHYRLEHMTDKISPTLSANRDHIIQKRIINAVDIHRRAIEFAEFMLSNFMIIYLILIGVGISSLTINLFQLLHLLMLNDMNGVLECIILIAAHLIYLFFSNLDGQLITDHNTDVFKTTYTTRWYTVSLKTQKLLFLIMQRSTKNYYFIVGGVFAASVESFASIT
ncbi:uncharacterized protein LOC114938478 [Nylanderia fulva]|uniref:uncharacterized protein LOC114938478 n=1 Tax=Nylanderia fulva TaxID=613905 RepID=UPI0010FAE3E2|nr:uncharacterized protein LOC114938478 [Nylanderia fulva]